MKEFLKHPSIRTYVSKPNRYEKGAIVCTESSYCDKIGIIIQGEVALIHYTINGREITLASLKENDIFGDFLIYTNKPFYPGNLIAQKPTIIQYIYREQLDALLKTSESFRKMYLTYISEKAMTMHRQNKLLMQPSIREKIHYYIARDATHHNHHVRYKNKTQLAKTLNVRRPSLSRELKKMREENIIDYDRNTLWFIDS